MGPKQQQKIIGEGQYAAHGHDATMQYLKFAFSETVLTQSNASICGHT